MTTAVTHHEQRNTTEATLFVAFELSEKTWKLGFTTGHGQKPRERTVTARQHEHVLNEIAQAKRRFGLPETAPVVSCYEAGREGFWLHRFLQAQGITNHVVDSSAIEVNRRRRRAKSDGLDVRKFEFIPVSFWYDTPRSQTARLVPKLRPSLSSEMDYRRQ